MDVYDRHGIWLGSVLWIEASKSAPAEPVATYPISALAFDGERLGPASTQGIGNTGPQKQAELSRAHSDAGSVVSRVMVGKWFGLRDRRLFESCRIINVSLEHIVVD